ncbi:MAG: hypothetical protein LBU60_01465 [Clostridiales bacterium]|jgi:hypothetical protein|nr:hypothetical protein [Clostridiales bacterium]
MKTTIKDVVYTAAMFAQLDDVVLLIENDETLHTIGDKVQSDDSEVNQAALDTLNLLIKCANLSIAEIAADYIPLTRRDILTASDGFILYSSFSQVIINVVRVVLKGQNVKFRLRPDRLEVPNGRYEIEYNYLPKRKKYESCIDYKSAIVTARIIAYGVLTEYCIISGMQDEAVLWDGRYRDSLVQATPKLEKRIRARKWS